MSELDHKELVKTLIDMSGDSDMGSLVIRTGQAPEVPTPVPINNIGNIGNPLEWVKKNPIPEGNPNDAFLTVERSEEGLSITYREDPKNVYGTVIHGGAAKSSEIHKLGINNKFWSIVELANFLRLNKHLFAFPEEVDKLVAELRSFSATVNKSVTREEKDSGYLSESFRREINSNITLKKISVSVPLFKGMSDKIFEVELHFDMYNGAISIMLFCATLKSLMHEHMKLIEKDFVDPFKRSIPVLYSNILLG